MGRKSNKNDSKKRCQRSGPVYTSDHEKLFTRNMANLGLRIKSMDADGNCMFRSIADQIYGDSSDTKEQHMSVRQTIMKYIQDHSDHFHLFFDEDNLDGDTTFDNYIQRLSTSGEWGDNLELYAACEAFRVRIIVHQSGADTNRYCLEPSESISSSSSSDFIGTIQLSYHGACHYNSIRYITDTDDTCPAIECDVHTRAATGIPDDDTCVSDTNDDSTMKIISTLKAIHLTHHDNTSNNNLTFKERKKQDILARKAARELTGLSKKEV